MNPNVYQVAAARTEADTCKSASRMESMLPVDPNCPDSLHLMPVRINHAVVGLAGEVGELAQLLERWVYYGQSLPIPDVEEEVGDCLWYLALLCTAVGIPMERAMEGNLAKLKARFPHKFTEEAAANRDPTAERKASEEATEKAEEKFASAYADGLKQLTERYGGVSGKPVSEIYPPPDEKTKDDEKMKRYAVQYGAVGKTPSVLRKPIDLPGAPQPGVVLLGGIPVPGVWACECGQINADCRMFCGCCNKRRKGQEDWLCECGHINLAVDPRCVKCEKPRVVESVTPDKPNSVSHEGDSAPKNRLENAVADQRIRVILLATMKPVILKTCNW
jgi:NTP pyrophosphatase (non-canonical NTP hydrolase)